MTKAALSQWVTAATNVAVLFGVLLLVFELRQNAELAQLGMVQDRISTFQQIEAAFLDPDVGGVFVKSYMEPASMNLAEIRAMDSFLAIHLNQVYRHYELEKVGLVKDGSTEKMMRGEFPFLFGSTFAKAWWEGFGKDWPPEFVQIAGPIVDAAKDDYLKKKFEKLQNALKSE